MDRETPMTVSVCDRDRNILKIYEAKFFDSEKRITFLFECEMLYKNLGEYGGDTHLRIEFLQDGRLFLFRGKIAGPAERKNRLLILANQISQIEEISRRGLHRIEIRVPVEIFYSDGRGRSDAQGVTLDISGDGLGLYSNDEINTADKNQSFSLTFSLGRTESRMLARLLRQKEMPRGAEHKFEYKFEYGFIFDHRRNPEERPRLITAMLDYQIKRM
jgi:hypothetical protein